MSILKNYSNKNIGQFISFPSSNMKDGNVVDSLYFAKYMNRLNNSDVDTVRASNHYVDMIDKWNTTLGDVDRNDLTEIGTKLKMNISVHSPFKSSTEMVGGTVEKKSYTSVHLLKVGGGSYKPIKFKAGAQILQSFGLATQRPPARPLAQQSARQSVRPPARQSAQPLLKQKENIRSIEYVLLNNIEQLDQLQKKNQNNPTLLKELLESFTKEPFENLMKHLSEIDTLVIFYETELGQKGGSTPTSTSIENTTTDEEVLELSKGNTVGQSVDGIFTTEKTMKNGLKCKYMYYFGTLLCAFVSKSVKAVDFTLSSVMEANLRIAKKTVDKIYNNELTVKEYEEIKVCVDSSNHQAISHIAQKKNQDGTLNAKLQELIENIEHKEKTKTGLDKLRKDEANENETETPSNGGANANNQGEGEGEEGEGEEGEEEGEGEEGEGEGEEGEGEGEIGAYITELLRLETEIAKIVSELMQFIEADMSFNFDFYFICKILTVLYIISHVVKDVQTFRGAMIQTQPLDFTDISTVENVLTNPAKYDDPIVISTDNMINLAIHNHNEHFNMRHYDEFTSEKFQPIDNEVVHHILHQKKLI